MEQPTQVVIRTASAGSDHAFIYSSWRNALWYAERRDPKGSDQFYRGASKRIASIIAAPDARVRIACLGDDPDMLLGWSVMLRTQLVFVYVKIDYRRKGIGRLLAKGWTTFSEPETKIGKSLKEKHGRKEEAPQAEPQPS